MHDCVVRARYLWPSKLEYDLLPGDAQYNPAYNLMRTLSVDLQGTFITPSVYDSNITVDPASNRPMGSSLWYEAHE
jgi:hypothetical protein